MKIGSTLLVVFVSVLLPLCADAAPVRWYLYDAVLSDGTPVEGSFLFDADTGTYSDFDVVTNPGTGFLPGSTMTFPVPGFPYDRISTRLVVTPTPEIVYIDDAVQDPTGSGVGIVELSFRSPLTGAGGFVELAGTSGPPVPSGFAGELTCPAPLDYPCVGQTRIRLFERGFVTTIPPTTAIPILDARGMTLLVLMLGLLGAFGLVRRAA